MADGSRALKNIKRKGESQVTTGRGERNRSPMVKTKPGSAHGMRHHSPMLMR